MQEETNGGYKPGDQVTATCYNRGCEDVAVEVTLGGLVGFAAGVATWDTGVGRLRWPVGSSYQLFELREDKGGSGYCDCPNRATCKTCFADVIVVFPPEGDPIIFGYDAEPA